MSPLSLSSLLYTLSCICVCLHIVLRIIISYQVKFIHISCFITGQTNNSYEKRWRLWRPHWVKIMKSFPSPPVLIYRIHIKINDRAGMIKPDGIYMLWQAFVFNSNGWKKKITSYGLKSGYPVQQQRLNVVKFFTKPTSVIFKVQSLSSLIWFNL